MAAPPQSAADPSEQYALWTDPLSFVAEVGAHEERPQARRMGYRRQAPRMARYRKAVSPSPLKIDEDVFVFVDGA